MCHPKSKALRRYCFRTNIHSTCNVNNEKFKVKKYSIQTTY